MKLLIRTKIIIVTIVLILVFGGIATYSVFTLTKNNLINLAESNLTQYVVSQGGEVDLIMSFSSELSKSIAENPDMIKVLESDETSAEELEHLTELHLKTYNVGDSYSAIYVLDSEGTTIISTDENFVGKNYSFRDYYSNAITGSAFVDVSVGVTSGELGYYFSHPVINAADEVVGVAVVKMRPEVFEGVFEHAVSSSMDMMLLDSYGIAVHTTDEEKFLHSMGSLTDEEADLLIQKRRYENIDIQPLSYGEIQGVLQNIEGEPSLFEIYDVRDGDDEYLSVYKIPEFPFYVVAEIELNELVQFSTYTSMIIALLVAFAAVISALSLSVIIRRYLSPLGELRETVEGMAKGNLAQEIKVRGEDEVGSLARSFNHMMQAVKESRAEVDSKVEQQTREIVKQQERAERAMKDLEEQNAAMTGRELKMVQLKKEIAELKKKSGK